MSVESLFPLAVMWRQDLKNSFAKRIWGFEFCLVGPFFLYLLAIFTFTAARCTVLHRA